MRAFGVRVTPARARVSGAMMMRFGSSSAPTVRGVKRLLIRNRSAAKTWCSLHAASDEDHLTRDPPGIVGGEEYSDGADVFRLPDAAQRSLRRDDFRHVRGADARGVKTFGLYHAGAQRVHADLFRTEFFRERLRDVVHRAFRGAVNDGAHHGV